MRNKTCDCGRAIVVKIRGRYKYPKDNDHDLCQRCFKAEKQRMNGYALQAGDTRSEEDITGS